MLSTAPLFPISRSKFRRVFQRRGGKIRGMIVGGREAVQPYRQNGAAVEGFGKFHGEDGAVRAVGGGAGWCGVRIGLVMGAAGWRPLLGHRRRQRRGAAHGQHGQENDQGDSSAETRAHNGYIMRSAPAESTASGGFSPGFAHTSTVLRTFRAALRPGFFQICLEQLLPPSYPLPPLLVAPANNLSGTSGNLL
jgi:hypothetical protein